jgi:hypothetical protein|tara:strand:+ start:32 stop:1417 length:1386 start_codon:yes stop_codon:yes gene_type:complete
MESNLTKMNNRLKSSWKQMSVKEFTDIKLAGKIKLEQSFQRGTDDTSSWTELDKKSYIHSTLKGTATNPIHLVNIKDAMEFNEGIDPESFKYFAKQHKRGKEWLSIDGNNRSITYKDFRNCTFKMKHEEYHVSRYVVQVNKDYDTYNTMAPNLREVYDETHVNLIIYSNVTLKQCAELFRDVNRGKALNDQQFRQSYLSEFADYVRAKRKKHLKSLEKFLSAAQIRELDGDAFIVKMISFAYYGECDKDKFDKMYFNSKNGHIEGLRLFKSDSNLNTVLLNFFKDISVGTNKLSSNAVFDYFILLWNYSLDNIYIDNHKEFYKLWLKEYSDLRISEVLYKIPGQNLMTSFHETIKKPLKGFGQFRQDTIKAKIELTAVESGYLIQQGDMRHRFYTPPQKYELWLKQDGKTPDGKKEIPIEEIYDHTKWQADHIKSWNKGGLTTIENGQLIEASVNNEKSNK